MVKDSQAEGWVPVKTNHLDAMSIITIDSGREGLSEAKTAVEGLHHAIVANRLADNKEILRCTVTPDLQYYEASRFFHHWSTNCGSNKHGLIFTNLAGASRFREKVKAMVDLLAMPPRSADQDISGDNPRLSIHTHRDGSTSSGISVFDVAAEEDDTVFVEASSTAQQGEAVGGAEPDLSVCAVQLPPQRPKKPPSLMLLPSTDRSASTCSTPPSPCCIEEEDPPETPPPRLPLRNITPPNASCSTAAAPNSRMACVSYSNKLPPRRVAGTSSISQVDTATMRELSPQLPPRQTKTHKTQIPTSHATLSHQTPAARGDTALSHQAPAARGDTALSHQAPAARSAKAPSHQAPVPVHHTQQRATVSSLPRSAHSTVAAHVVLFYHQSKRKSRLNHTPSVAATSPVAPLTTPSSVSAHRPKVSETSSTAATRCQQQLLTDRYNDYREYEGYARAHVPPSLPADAPQSTPTLSALLTSVPKPEERLPATVEVDSVASGLSTTDSLSSEELTIHLPTQTKQQQRSRRRHPSQLRGSSSVSHLLTCCCCVRRRRRGISSSQRLAPPRSGGEGGEEKEVLEQCEVCDEWFLRRDNVKGACSRLRGDSDRLVDSCTCTPLLNCCLRRCTADSSGRYSPAWHSSAAESGSPRRRRRHLLYFLLGIVFPCIWCYKPCHACHNTGKRHHCWGSRHVPVKVKRYPT